MGGKISTEEGVMLGRSSACCLLVMFGAVTGAQLLYSIQEVSAFNAAHWAWDYSLGFIKRGFPGAVAEALVGPASKSYEVISTVSTLILVALLAIYVVFATAVIIRRPSLITVVAALSGLILAPGMPQFMYDLGRPDQVNFILFMIACAAAVRGSRVASGIIVASSGSLAMLIHEGFLFIHLPSILAIYFVRLTVIDEFRSGKAAKYCSAALMLPLFTFVVVWAAGSPNITDSDWNRYWTTQAEFLVEPSGAGALDIHFRSLKDNIFHTLSGVGALKLVFSALTVFAALALSVSALAIYRPAGHKVLPIVCITAALSPLSMFFIGLDYMRWSSMTFNNLLVAILSMVWLMPRKRGSRLYIRDRGGKIVMIFALYVYLATPLSAGVAHPRPLPDGVLCIFGVQGIATLEPRRPDDCLSRKFSGAAEIRP